MSSWGHFALNSGKSKNTGDVATRACKTYQLGARAGESRSATMVRIAFGSLPAGLHDDDVCAKSWQSDFDICGGRSCSRGAYSLR
jgi:hypothetical protein